MRGIIRKVINANDREQWIIIFALSIILLGFYLVFSMPIAEAITRQDLDDLEKQVHTLEENIEEKDIEITDQKILIKDTQDKIEELKIELRDAKRESTGGWDSLDLIYEIEGKLSQAEIDLKEFRDNLFEFLTEKSDFIKLSKELNITIDESDLDNPPSLSHLTTKIGVSLSKSCETMIKNNFTTNCPSYKQLVQLDSSDTDISGKFTTDDDGFFHRGPELVLDSYKFYWNDEQIRIFVDPPGSMVDRIKMIEIRPNFDTYTIPGDMVVPDKYELAISNKTETLGNLTRVVNYEFRNQTETYGTVIYHDRYIDKCKDAVINANNWKFLIGDTIHLMRNNCDRDFTAFEEREVTIPEKSVIDITTSPNWIYQQWLKHTEEFCIFKYKAC